MRGTDTNFALTREALRAKQKDLKCKGKGNKPNRSQPITDEEINALYSKKLMGKETPEAIVNTLWFNNSVHFGLRGVTEHYNLKWGDVTLKKDMNGLAYLELNERQTKTITGDNVKDIRDINPKMYENKNNKERGALAIYKRYAELRPADFCQREDPFYIAPNTMPISATNPKWFRKQVVGINKLGSIMKKMKEKANITERKKLTNTSSRKYLIQKLRDKNIPPTDIMQISGHKNVQSINSYSNISEKQQQTYSNYLRNTGHPSNDDVNPHPQNKEISSCTAADCSISSSQTCNIQQNKIISNPFYGSNITV
jgi:hypothetical protein